MVVHSSLNLNGWLHDHVRFGRDKILSPHLLPYTGIPPNGASWVVMYSNHKNDPARFQLGKPDQPSACIQPLYASFLLIKILVHEKVMRSL